MSHPGPVGPTATPRTPPPCTGEPPAGDAAVGRVLLAAAVTSCGRPDPLAGFAAPRTVHLAPDDRVLVTDQGTGRATAG